jgi:sulfur carrier protein ThiS
MPECDYCGASHDSEDAHLSHLKADHYGDLGPIDKRRVDDATGGSDIPFGPIAVGVVLLAAAAVVGYVVFVVGGSGGSNVGPSGSAHYHGTMEMTVLGDEVDFSQSQYQLRDDRFHFEEGNGETWHAHATGVTFGYAMNALGFDVSTDPKAIRYGGETYADGDKVEVIFEVNGEAVGPEYVLKGGDEIRVVVREA